MHEKEMKDNISIEFEDIADDLENILLVDIRDRISFQHGHIKTAVSITDHICYKINELIHIQQKNKIVVYCSFGQKSREIVLQLRKQGVNAWNLTGGFHAWLKKQTCILNNDEIAQYSRQFILPEISIDGQEKIKNSKILVAGAGGLGSPVLLYLAAAGVGTIGIIDGDKVDITNLQRQVVHKFANIGRNKAVSAREQILALNPHITVKIYEEFLTPDNIEQIIKDYDFVIDGVDNFESKFLINDACVIQEIPFCHAGILKFEGQVMTWAPNQGPCYRCIFENIPDDNIPNCSQVGIIGAVAGIIGSIQALEAIKYITDAGELLTGKMFILDGLSMNTRIVRFKNKSDNCKVCGVMPQITNIKEQKYLYSGKICKL